MDNITNTADNLIGGDDLPSQEWLDKYYAEFMSQPTKPLPYLKQQLLEEGPHSGGYLKICVIIHSM
jgi:hypothetical protein